MYNTYEELHNISFKNHTLLSAKENITDFKLTGVYGNKMD